MEASNQLEKYFRTLYSFFNFNGVLSIFNQLYPSEEILKLNKKFELSLLINPKDNLNARFGLFQLFESGSIINLFKNHGYDDPKIGSLFSLMEGFSPEYGLGFDYKEDAQRIKTYFLRLQDNPKFNEGILLKINEISNLFNINSEHLKKLKKEDCYLIGVDHYLSDKNNLKLYFRELNVEFNGIIEHLKNEEIDSKYLSKFFNIFLEREFKDVTFSYKYSNQIDKLSGFSLFFEVAPNLNDKIDKLIENSIPEKFNKFKNLKWLFEQNGSLIEYSHIGITFSLNSESICLYYFPDFGGSHK